MVGQRVIYYVMVDNVTLVPKLHLVASRSMEVIQVKKHSRWQDVSMMRMQDLTWLIKDRLQHEVDYLFCLDVDQEFKDRFGTEALGEMVAQLHAQFLFLPQNCFTYERRAKSVAYIAAGQGDYYYHAAVFGGRVGSVLNLTRACLDGIIRDKTTGIEAIWHDESHLNRYFLDHKPTKLLSPEYCWDRSPIPYLKKQRLIWLKKEYSNVREN
ncbi:N-acetyllactosaminide alpha-1,3-galactosyltransferase-like [Latimeria chalumnae]